MVDPPAGAGEGGDGQATISPHGPEPQPRKLPGSFEYLYAERPLEQWHDDRPLHDEREHRSQTRSEEPHPPHCRTRLQFALLL